MNKLEWRISDGAVSYAEALAVMEERVADIRAVGPFSEIRSTVSFAQARERRGNAVRNSGSKSAAAPATVSGEPVPQSHWECPGKAVTGSDPRARRPTVGSVGYRAGRPR